MAFTATLAALTDTAKITLTGELDANSAPIFKAEIEQATLSNPQRLVLMMAELEYMSSAGLRVLIFAKQKMGVDVDIYVVAAQEMIIDTLEKTGFIQGVFVVDNYEQTQLQSV